MDMPQNEFLQLRIPEDLLENNPIEFEEAGFNQQNSKVNNDSIGIEHQSVKDPVTNDILMQFYH